MRKPRFFFSNIFLVFHIDRWPSLPLINLIWGNNRKVILLAYNCKDIPWSGGCRRRWQTLAYSYQVWRIEGGRRRGQQRIRWLDGITDSMDMSLSKLRCQGMFNRRIPTCCFSQVLCFFLNTTAGCSQELGVIVRDRLESPLVNILFTTKLLSLNPLSWDMDCLLTLWPSSSLVPLVTVTVHLVFWSLSLMNETSCTTAYIYSQKNH